MGDLVCNIALIKEDFFIRNKHFVEMLDVFNIVKQTKRMYTFFNVKYKNNNIFVPLRRETFSNETYGVVGYPLPTTTRPNAGLDFRKMLIINEVSFINIQEKIEIPNSQRKILINDYAIIEKLATDYIEGYIKSAIKCREKLDSKYKFSTLHNFHKELNIDKARELKNKSKLKNLNNSTSL